MTGTIKTGVSNRIDRRGWFGYVPGLVAGVFLSRVVGEWFGLPSVWAAVGLAVGFGLLGMWLLARLPVARTWPALILLVYIVYPEPMPQLAFYAFLVALVAFLLNEVVYRNRFADPLGRSAAPARWLMVLAACVIAAVFFLLYLTTLAPDVLAADSGELQVVAAQLGVAHPPGFPLYTIMAHAVTRLLPFVSPAYAVNLFSAVTSALTVAVVYMTGTIITRRHLPGLIAAVALGTATTFWSQATTANVRSLTGLFAALIILSLVSYREAISRNDATAAGRWLVASGLLMGLGVTHHVSLVFLVAIGLAFIVLVDRSILRQPRRWVWPVGAALLGLLPLLYLPFRAAADVRGAAPDLATWPGFIEHVLATGFRGDLFYFTAPSDFVQRLRIMGNVLSFQFEVWLLAAMFVGLVVLLWQDRSLAFLLGGAFAVFTLVAATYRAPQTVEYMIPAYAAAALLIGCAIGWMVDRVGQVGVVLRAALILFVALVIASCLHQAVQNRVASGAEHEGVSAREYAGPLLADAPPNSTILAHWHWATPLWYLQEVEGLRPDVDVQFVYPEGEPYDVTWERRAREVFETGRPVITTWVPAAQLDGLPVPEPIGEALLFPQITRTELPEVFTATSISLGDAVKVVGYHVEEPERSIAAGQEMVVTVAWEPLVERDMYGLYLHLVGSDGVLYGQDDRSVAAADGLTLTQFRLTPRPGVPTGPSTLNLGATGEGGGRELLTSVDLVPPLHRLFTRNRTARALVDNPDEVLIGYDWDHTLPGRSRLYLHWATGGTSYATQVLDDDASMMAELPPYRGPWGVSVNTWRFPRGKTDGYYVPLGQGIVWTGEVNDGLALTPGESAVLDQEFFSGQAINRDLIVSVRLIGLEPDGVHWAWWDLQDSVPAMGAIPTLKWVDGVFVRSPHRVMAAERAVSGQTLTGALTLYDAFTNRPLAILDERLTDVNPWIPILRGSVD